MTHPFLALFATVVAIATIAVQAPNAHAAQQTAPAPAAPSTTMPGLIGMCEDSDGCSDWGFNGNQGMGIWVDGANATLTITHLDPNSITIHRVDSKGAATGLTADYTGTISNFWIEGEVTASWPGHQQGQSHTKWHGLIFPPPNVIRNTAQDYAASLKQASAWTVCHDTGDKCSAASPPIDTLMVLAGQSAAMRMLPDASAQIFLYLNQLPDGTIQIRRFDKNGILGGITSLYTGKRVGGKITGTLQSMWPGHGNTVGAGNFVALAAPGRCTSTMNAPLALQTGLMANLLENKSESFNCLLAAATQGDSGAAATTGLYYYAGWGTPVDYKKALYWLQKAGDQDDAIAGLSAIYLKGQGVPADLLLGHYYADKVELRKRYRARYPDSAQKPWPGMEHLVNVVGDLFGWIYNLGDKFPIVPLQEKVSHEGLVLINMDQGMSRVQAEQKFYDDLQARHEANRTECQPPGPYHYNDSLSAQANRRAEDSAQNAYGFCQMIDALSEASFQEKIGGYRSCVEKYVDSNAIEEHCEFPLPRLGF
jgi:hypothetical protein